MGWSKDGLIHMSSMRIFCQNGGSFFEQLKKESLRKRTEASILKLDRHVLRKANQVSGGVLPNVPFYLQDKKSGTSVILKSIRGL